MAHDPNNDTCVSSPFEGCICHLPTGEQDRLVSVALGTGRAPKLTTSGWIGEADDDLVELEDASQPR